MTDDIESRILEQFRLRLTADANISPKTREALLAGEASEGFGDDDELLDEIVGLESE